jgi:hypothetical protein
MLSAYGVLVWSWPWLAETRNIYDAHAESWCVTTPSLALSAWLTIDTWLQSLRCKVVFRLI